MAPWRPISWLQISRSRLPVPALDLRPEPLFSFAFLNAFISRSTLLPALGLYFLVLDFFLLELFFAAAFLVAIDVLPFSFRLEAVNERKVAGENSPHDRLVSSLSQVAATSGRRCPLDKIEWMYSTSKLACCSRVRALNVCCRFTRDGEFRRVS